MLKAMADFGFTLDLSHMDELSARQSLDLYEGPVIASHANAAALLPGYEGNRLLPDDVIKGLIARDGIIGVVPFCAFLDAGWKKGIRVTRLPLKPWPPMWTISARWPGMPGMWAWAAISMADLA